MAMTYEKGDNIEVVVMTDEQFEYKWSYNTPAEKRRMVNRIKAEVRSSLEYEDYIMFLRQNVGMDACAFFNNMSKQTNKKVRIEVHHTPLTIDDIVKLVLDKRIMVGEEINDLQIAKEVAKIHYNNQVGLIPLSKTVHEVVHNNTEKLVIPMHMIFGDYVRFLAEYEDALNLDENKPIRKKIEQMIERTKDLNADSFDCLKTKFTYIKVDGYNLPVKIEDEEEIKKQLKNVA